MVEGGFILKTECISRIMKIDSKQKLLSKGSRTRQKLLEKRRYMSEKRSSLTFLRIDIAK
jgi:hypothetical protein